ncbi:hypothetical protein THERMOT_1426 [Bathymodiolus thermophilus thioautotrophic gill symbiont]|uniref:hypothetical protein n=1 Tax=Bathymodiolus thermophilus thioautotrophic gill symbiont TaxID=2360 RepID=UPI00111607FA|nr:hypothetical protein [Bathymodiolus thermophilus thioautotrophic gill symbiont]CAB5501482.1 hypothetical protein THERMOT_1426 [Bathymodiolus thermophilus thioautotrophic gill symbiont]
MSSSVIAHDKNNDALTKEIEKSHHHLSTFKIKLKTGVNTAKISTQTNKQKLLHYERHLGTPKSHENNQWGESEAMILEAKMKLQTIENKMSVQGNWGQIKLRVQGLKSKDPGRVKLKYQYGF